MSSTNKASYALALDVKLTDAELIVDLADGRKISVPLVWFPRLLSASPSARNNWELLGDGEGIHWPDADEDISVSGLLSGSKGDAGLISGAA